MIACDTSAVAKLYVPEKKSRAIRQLLERADQVCLSDLVRPEIMAVLHRRLGEGIWGRRDFLAAVRQFQHDDLAGFWTRLPVDGFILRAAAETFTTVPPTIFLRSSDCIHLVTALHHNVTEFLTFDAQDRFIRLERYMDCRRTWQHTQSRIVPTMPPPGSERLPQDDTDSEGARPRCDHGLGLGLSAAA